MAEQDIIVRIKAEGADAFIKQVKAAGGEVVETGKKVDKASGEITKGFKKIGAALGAAFATAELIRFGKELAKLAVQIDADNKKVQKVFGDSTGAVERFAKQSATSLGLTSAEFKKAAAAAGDLLIPLGFQRQEAANLSVQLVQLSGALSAWSGGQLSATQVSEVLTKALLGEREQLKLLGIQINEADVSARLLQKGQHKLTGATLAQAKATATLELITEKSADAQAAFADETKTLAEQSLILGANIREIRDSLAQALIPALTNASQGAINLIENFKELRARLNDLTARGGANASEIRGISDALFEYATASEATLIAERERLQSIEQTLDATKRQRREQESAALSIQVINELLDTQGLSLEQVRDELKKLDPENEKTRVRLEVLTKRWYDLNKAIGGDGGSDKESAIYNLTLLKDRVEELQDQLLLAPIGTEQFATLQDKIKAAKKELDAAVISVQAMRNALKELDNDGPLNNIGEEIINVPLILNRAARQLKDSEFAEYFDETLKEDVAEFESAWERALANVDSEAEKFWQDFAKSEQDAIALQGERTQKALSAFDDINTAQQNSFALFRTIQTRQKQILDNRLAQGLISEKEYQQELARLRTKEARAAKVQAIFNLTVSLAEAIGKAFTRGPLIGQILAGISAAAITAQIAAVASTTIPQFAKGTKGKKKAPAGFKWVGEEGPELLYDKGGYNIMTAKDSDQIAKLLGSYGIPTQFKGKTTINEIDRPLKSLSKLKGTPLEKMDWGPMLNASDRQRMSLGRKLDKIHTAIIKGQSFNRPMTRA